jgi:hypothetical protein
MSSLPLHCPLRNCNIIKRFFALNTLQMFRDLEARKRTPSPHTKAMLCLGKKENRASLVRALDALPHVSGRLSPNKPVKELCPKSSTTSYRPSFADLQPANLDTSDLGKYVVEDCSLLQLTSFASSDKDLGNELIEVYNIYKSIREILSSSALCNATLGLIKLPRLLPSVERQVQPPQR